MQRSSNESWLLCIAMLATACGSQRTASDPPADKATTEDQAPAPPQAVDSQGTATEQSPASADATQTDPQINSDGIIRTGRTELVELAPVADYSSVPVSLCTMVRHPGYGGYGLYEVTGLTAYIEHIDGNEVSATYVELKRLQDFYQAEENVTARIGGGPTSDGALALWDIHLKLGESIAVLGFVKPAASNLGYPGLDPTQVFKRRADGGYSNGAHFTQRVVGAEKLGRLVAGLAGRSLEEPCPYDVEPDRARDTQPPDPLPPEGEDPDVTTPDAGA